MEGWQPGIMLPCNRELQTRIGKEMEGSRIVGRRECCSTIWEPGSTGTQVYKNIQTGEGKASYRTRSAHPRRPGTGAPTSHVPSFPREGFNWSLVFHRRIGEDISLMTGVRQRALPRLSDPRSKEPWNPGLSSDSDAAPGCACGASRL